MRLAVFDEWRIGVVEDDGIIDVTDALPAELALLPKQRVNWLIEHWAQAGPALLDLRNSSPARLLTDVRLLAPSPAPAHVFAAPANYHQHIGELGERAVTEGGRTAREQGFFLKAPGSVSGASQDILLPRASPRRFDHEAELACIVGRAGRNIPRGDALSYVFGYACLIDLTMRIEPGVAAEERSMRKSFETFTPLGPWIVTADEVGDPGALDNRLWVNGDLRQHANTADLIVGVAELVELVSSVLPLSPGDVIATGTPQGVGPVADGDLVRIAIDRVGEMALRVRQHSALSPRRY